MAVKNGQKKIDVYTEFVIKELKEELYLQMCHILKPCETIAQNYIFKRVNKNLYSIAVSKLYGSITKLPHHPAQLENQPPSPWRTFYFFFHSSLQQLH